MFQNNKATQRRISSDLDLYPKILSAREKTGHNSSDSFKLGYIISKMSVNVLVKGEYSNLYIVLHIKCIKNLKKKIKIKYIDSAEVKLKNNTTAQEGKKIIIK